MTLDQLRTELEQGTLRRHGAPALPSTALGGALERALHAVATNRQAGVRLQLPRQFMPVLP